MPKSTEKNSLVKQLEYLAYLLTDRPAALLVRIHVSLLKAWLPKETYSGDTSVQEILTNSLRAQATGLESEEGSKTALQQSSSLAS